MASSHQTDLVNTEKRTGYVYGKNNAGLPYIEVIDIEIMKILDIRLDIAYSLINGPCLEAYRCCNCSVNNSQCYHEEHLCSLWPEGDYSRVKYKPDIFHYYEVVTRSKFDETLLPIELSEMPNLIKINEARFNNWVTNPIVIEKYDIDNKRREIDNLYELLDNINNKINRHAEFSDEEEGGGERGEGAESGDDESKSSASSRSCYSREYSKKSKPPLEDQLENIKNKYKRKHKKLKNKYNKLNNKYNILSDRIDSVNDVIKGLSSYIRDIRDIKTIGAPGSADGPIFNQSINSDILLKIATATTTESMLKIKNEIIDELDKFITPISIKWTKHILSINKGIVKKVKDCDIDTELTTIRNKLLEYNLIFNIILEYIDNDEHYKDVTYLSRIMTLDLFNNLIKCTNIGMKIKWIKKDYFNYNHLYNNSSIINYIILDKATEKTFGISYKKAIENYVTDIVNRFLTEDKILELKNLEIEIISGIKAKLYKIINPYIKKCHWQAKPDYAGYNKESRNNIYYNRIYTPIEAHNNIGIADNIKKCFIDNITTMMHKFEKYKEDDVEFTLIDNNVVCTQLEK